MEVMNRSNPEDFSFFEDGDNVNELEKTFVTVHADSFNEKDFNNLLNCLDTIRESENKKRNKKKVIKNYCVQVPYIDNSIVKGDDDDEMPSDIFDKTCSEMKNNISQMFSYFDEDVTLNFDDDDEDHSESFRERFIRSRKRIKELSEGARKKIFDLKPMEKIRNSAARMWDKSSKGQTPEMMPMISNFEMKQKNPKPITKVSNFDIHSETQNFDVSSVVQKWDTLSKKNSICNSKPVIKGAIKKANAPSTPTNSLNKNQVDKIMNEFNRVKINYYSKDNFVEFTNIDYFFCDSDLESVKSEKVGKLTRNVLSKFEAPEDDKSESKKSMSLSPEVPVLKNSVRDKVSMFSKLDVELNGSIRKEVSAPAVLQQVKLQRNSPSHRLKNLIKNTSSTNKNMNKCFIRDINTSLQVKADSTQSTTMDILDKINELTMLNDVNLLLQLERIVNKFNMSLLHTIDGLVNDDAFTLVGSRMKHLNVETRPSINRFNETFAGAHIDCSVENSELRAVDASKVQLQMHVFVSDEAKRTTESVEINVIFMAQYETDSSAVPRLTTDVDEDENTFFIYFTSLFEPPENELQKARDSNIALSEHQLRVQASLQKLNIPDWYKQYSSSGHNSSANTSFYNKSDVTGLLRKRNSDIGRWQGLSSKTTSLSSLGSNRSDRSPVMLSPSAHSHTGAGQTGAGFSRWSTSHLNSSQTSPSVSARSSFVRNTTNYSSTMSGQSATSTGTSQAGDIRNSFRKPYLGWRSQEKLAQPRTPHERLASSMQNQQKIQQPVATPEIQSSIKEVTSAIVHFVNDQTNRGSRSRSVSPSTRCWLESSFVGTKPIESPQTPALEKPFGHSQKINIGPMSVAATNYDSIRINGVSGESTVI